MSVTVQVRKIDVSSGHQQLVNEPIAKETPINLLINNRDVITLLGTPTSKKELGLGWFFSEGVLQSVHQIKDIVVKGSNVNLITSQPVPECRLDVAGVSRLLTAPVDRSKFLRTVSQTAAEPVNSQYAIRASEVLTMVKVLEAGKLYRKTRGVHVAALFQNGKLVALKEDIGRHNAVDKAIGAGILAKTEFSNAVLVSSARQPADMVLKTARMGIPIIVSIAGPTRSGVIAAKKSGITLVCFAEADSIRIYACPYRIMLNG